MEPAQPTARVEDKLYTLRWKHDRTSHIAITDPRVCVERCGDRWRRPCTTFCPAKVYEWDPEQARIVVAYENCVECTTCLVGCPYRVIDWRPPRGGFGIQYRYG